MLHEKILYPLMFFVLRIPVGECLDKCRAWNALTEERRKNEQLQLLHELAVRNRTLTAQEAEALKHLESVDAMASVCAPKAKRDLLNAEVSGTPVVRETAGTTGVPVRLYYSREHIARQLAVRAYCWEQIGVPYGSREARFWGRRDFSFKSKLKNWFLNRKVFNFLDGDCGALACELIEYSPDYIYGYSSIVLRAAVYFREHNISPPPLKSVICTAESLHAFQRDFIAEVFHCPVYMEYGCTEVDIVAFQCAAGSYHLVNPWLVVEAVEHQVLVTDVGQDLLPVVRYAIGDEIEFSPHGDVCRCGRDGRVITSIKGRSINQVVKLRAGRTAHAVIFAYIADDLNREVCRVARFLVTQMEVGSFEFVVEPRSAVSDIDHAAVEAYLRKRFQHYCNDTADFDFKCVKEFPFEAGRKMSYFVSCPSE